MYEVEEAKVVYFPMTRTNADGEEKTSFMKLGVRIKMVDGKSWFRRFKSIAKCSDGEERTITKANEWVEAGTDRSYVKVDASSWTRTTPGKDETYKSRSTVWAEGGKKPAKTKDTKHRFGTDAELMTKLAACPLLPILQDAFMQAMIEDAEKKAA